MFLTKKNTMNTIKVVIYYTYENLKVRKEIIKCRKKFMIPNHFFETHKPDNKILDSSASRCMFAFTNKYFKDQNILNMVIENIGEENYKIEVKKTNKTIKKDFKLNYAIGALDKHISQYDNIDFYKSVRLNPIICWEIVVSKLFEVPQNIVIEHMDQSLDAYFPTINNQGNKSTDTENVKHAKYMQIQKINNNKKHEEQKQKTQKTIKVIVGYLYNINKPLEYPCHDIDKKAFELKHNNRMKRAEIVEDKDFKKFNFEGSDHSHLDKRIKRYEKFIQPYPGYFMGELAYRLRVEQEMSDKEIAKKLTNKFGSAERKKYKKHGKRYQLSVVQIKKYEKDNWLKNAKKVEYGKYEDYHVDRMIKRYLEFIEEIS